MEEWYKIVNCKSPFEEFNKDSTKDIFVGFRVAPQYSVFCGVRSHFLTQKNPL
jgi:hypothetical protein